jgi:hypothetical protein
MSVNPFDLKTVVLAKHAQHVVLIHFPIALFMVAVAFDFLAQWAKNRKYALRAPRQAPPAITTPARVSDQGQGRGQTFEGPGIVEGI